MRNLTRVRSFCRQYAIPTATDDSIEYVWTRMTADASQRVYVAGFPRVESHEAQASDDGIPAGALVACISSTPMRQRSNPTAPKALSPPQVIFDSLGECDPPLPMDAQPILVQFLSDHSALCFVCDSGHIFLIPMQLPGLHDESAHDEFPLAECPGFVADGISAAAWSPDGELLVLITGDGNMLLMSANWDVIHEESVLVDEKDTSAKRITTPLSSSVCWRGDGKFFVCNVVDSRSGLRIIKVFDRDGKLSARCEQSEKAENTLAWRPSGNLIASTEKQPNGKYYVIFYERNGLRHGEFVLPFDPQSASVLQLGWNIESDVLAVLTESQGQNYLQLFTMSNYHWYLKQELRLPKVSHATFLWHEEKPYFISVLTADCFIHEFEFSWDTNISGGPEATNMSTAAVIDGASLMLTPLRRTLVPPPMCSATLLSSAPIQIVDFLSSGEIACVSSDGFITLTEPYTIQSKGAYFDATQPPKITAHLQLHTCKANNIKAAVWLSADTIVILSSSADPAHDIIDVFRIDALNQDYKIENITSFNTPSVFIKLSHDKVNGTLLGQSIDGGVYAVHVSREVLTVSLQLLSRFQTPCNIFSSTMVSGKVIPFGLNDRYNLYSGEHLISSECNSFFVHDQFLVFTSLRHNLHMIPLYSEWPPANFSPDAPEYTRAVERGSRIVAAVPYDVKVVLQMPRGNLEGICPRAILIRYICKMLDRKEYGKAFLEMRRQRVDLNLIYDYDPVAFCDDIDMVINQLDNVDYVNLLISSMRDEDTMPVMFATVQAKSKSPAPSDTSKVNHICDLIRASLTRIDDKRYFLSIITTLAKRNPPLLEETLEIIRQRRDSPQIQSDDAEIDDQPTPEEALEYAIFLVDVNKLYDIALGMYDFDLVKMVAQKSSKDPKEYLPFLSELQKLAPQLQKYTIDKLLKRFERALTHISQAGDEHFDKCIELIQEHNLYKLGLKLFEKNQTRLCEITLLYADYLSSQNRHQEAGLAYLTGNEDKKALTSFTNAGSVHYTFSTAAKLGMTASEKSQLAYTISEVLKNSGRHSESAAILVDYCQDADEAVTILIEGRLWEETLSLACRADRFDLVETTVDSAVIEGFETLLTEVQENTARYEKYYGRLVEIRSNRAVARVTVDDEDDAQSEAATETGSLWSGYSSRLSIISSATSGSTRSTRRARQRSRKTKFKDGSVEEDAYLIKLLSQIIPTQKYLGKGKKPTRNYYFL
eukprot:TRINITY_DN5361_c0_g1_i1.p1 TRINITY_DN5361_c0_g1~~TRINITY_DN5361_c0_g1_i1.p1  ORF type:complete len:1221 (-),score=246.17 TRINITY_DN5361_c0_g1_i1:42-3704(-)